TIPIEDKLISRYDNIENLQEFMNLIYEKYSNQVIQYAEGKISPNMVLRDNQLYSQILEKNVKH
ncbi:hypothetical protein LCGC14_2696950, partial [marine sediment metagenome]